MEGFESVFDQLLTERELLFLIDALETLDEPQLAAAFRRAHQALRGAGFYDRPHAMCYQFGRKLRDELDAVSEAVDFENRMWALDAKLAQLVI